LGLFAYRPCVILTTRLFFVAVLMVVLLSEAVKQVSYDQKGEITETRLEFKPLGVYRPSYPASGNISC
jgi:hypothetical protein